MDDGKPSGPKASWWSRPKAVERTLAEPEVPPARDGGPSVPPLTDAVPTDAVPADAVPVAADSPSERATDGDDDNGPRPDTDPAAETGAVTVPAEGPGAFAPDAAGAPAAPPERPRPLHEPDEYSTPPYGGPGPWAPAPPVQLPTPAHGTALPPAYGTPHGAQGAPAPHVPYAHPAPPPPPPSGQDPFAQSFQYDPWSSPVPRQPLTQYGEQYREPGGRRGRVGTAALVLLAFAGCVLGGVVGAYVERNGGFTTVELPQAGPESADRAPESVAGIAASALPGVVTLHVRGGGEQGTGTGFVLDQRGHILTNNHVVQPAGTSGEISVTFSGGQTASAKLVGKDTGYDLAVVKVTGVSGLKPLPLGNSDNVRVGDPVVAIGAPFDLSNTVTSGIISAKERPITAGGEKGDGSDISYVDALQTDAPINPGNSGGPLVDGRARVIGINSAIRAADSGSGLAGGQSGSIGLGFAIPINQAKRVAEELINTGKATHPVIGVSLDMQYAGDGAKVGAKAADGGPAVTAGGPGAKAGIRPGDIITRVNGQRVHSGEELIVKIRAHRPGDQLELTLLRGGKEQTMKMALGSADGG
ncbi:trypsin-like peptidase domain-containing protein [Streptomyces paludis]|uniref:PDZ domain-containing protein n=1 Tax=Streptomyces paludis TaxID=2282738 RepID=A0A345HTS2_9ACTN|nr:trypsin-like peptidase domain-containing protein [Streptomyces paludis]AXG80096.1 PDZ domain-containing protein [Streptomyces paludis]